MEIDTPGDTAQHQLAQSGTAPINDHVQELVQKTGLPEMFFRNCMAALAEYHILGFKRDLVESSGFFEAHLIHERGGIALITPNIIGEGSFKQVRHGYFASLMNWSYIEQAFISPRNSTMGDSVAIKAMIDEFHLAFRLAQIDPAGVIDAPSCLFWDQLRPGIPLAMATMATADLQKAPPTSEEELVRFLQQGATALSLIHSVEVIHNDVKAPNFLRVGENFKLTDFGLAIRTNAQVGFKGTPLLASHEAFKEGYIFKPAKDIYSLGVLILQFVQHLSESDTSSLADVYPEFIELARKEVDTAHDFAKKLRTTSRLRTWITPSGGETVRKLIGIAELCLNVTPCKRPTADQILKKI